MSGKEAVKVFQVDAVTAETHAKLHPDQDFGAVVAEVMDFLGDLARTGRDFDVYTTIVMRVCDANMEEASLVQQVWQRYVDEVVFIREGAP